MRGLGGLCAIELVRNLQTLEPADTEAKEVARYCWQHGVVTILAGTYNNVVRLPVPLVIRDEQFEEGLGVIEAALAYVAEQRNEKLSRASRSF